MVVVTFIVSTSAVDRLKHMTSCDLTHLFRLLWLILPCPF